jgi:hypothetical protein
MSEFNYKSLFLLGAGASCPYGYPSGEELTSNIYNECLLLPKGRTYLALKQLFHETEILKFAHDLRASNQVSIDAFLKERKADYEQIGKIAIAINILDRERDLDSHYPRNGNWVKYLISRVIGNDLKKFEKAKFNFITFNYDRSLEFLMYQSIKSLFNLDSVKTKKTMTNYQFHHFYGSLGQLPELEDTNLDTSVIPFGYSRPNHLDHLHHITKNLRVMHDERNERLDENLTDYFYHSEKIFILGFGFDELNIKRLNIKWSRIRGKIYCTSYNLRESEKSRILQMLNIGVDKIHFLEGDCENLVREKLSSI